MARFSRLVMGGSDAGVMPVDWPLARGSERWIVLQRQAQLVVGGIALKHRGVTAPVELREVVILEAVV
jgi:hypothetical protein